MANFIVIHIFSRLLTTDFVPAVSLVEFAGGGGVGAIVVAVVGSVSGGERYISHVNVRTIQ